MAIADWFRGKDPVLQHLAERYALRSGQARGSLEGRLRQFALRTCEKQTFAQGIQVDLGDCTGDPCFGFYRPSSEDLAEASAFGDGGMARWESGEPVQLAGFFLDYEGEPHWRAVLDRHALACADYLARFSLLLTWVYFHPPGLSVKWIGPQVRNAATPDLAAIDRDLETAARLLEVLREVVPRQP